MREPGQEQEQVPGRAQVLEQVQEPGQVQARALRSRGPEPQVQVLPRRALQVQAQGQEPLHQERGPVPVPGREQERGPGQEWGQEWGQERAPQVQAQPERAQEHIPTGQGQGPAMQQQQQTRHSYFFSL